MKKINNRGFSLIEILIVLGLIGTIVAYIATKVTGASENAKVKQSVTMMRGVIENLEMYRNDCGSYPTTTQGLRALTEKPAGEPACESWGPEPYSKDIPRDAWKTEFVYESADGIDYEIISYGANKRPGGEGSDEDISSSKLNKSKK